MDEINNSGLLVSCFRRLITEIFPVLLSIAWCCGAFAETMALPRVDAPATHYEFASVFEGQVINHDFLIRNKGDAPLEIIEVKTD